MASTARRIVVDDSSSDIVFYGNWTVDSRGSQDGVGNSGPTFQHTLHTVQGDFGFVNFIFEGPTVDVVGRIASGRNADGTEPSWECVVDGRTTTESATVERDQNNQVLCSFAGLQEGEHSLILRANSVLFSVDYMRHTPSSGNTRGPSRSSGNFVSIPSQDSTFSYDCSWIRPSDSGFATVSTVGATFNTTFIGSTLMWYGVIPAGTSGTAQGTYSIDGQPPVTFVVNRPTSSASGDLTNQVFFETPLLTYGGHSLSVTYTADGGLPLTLDRLVVRDQQIIAITPMTASGLSTPTAWGSASAAATWSPEGGFYAGRRGSMSGGAIVATVIVAALLFFWRRRRTRRAGAQVPAQGFVPHMGDEKAVGKADTSSIFSRIREKIKKEKEELDYAKPPVQQLPAYKARNSGIQEEVVDRV